MRCIACPYREYSESFCKIVKDYEKTTNKFGIGCKYNLATLQKRRKVIEEYKYFK